MWFVIELYQSHGLITVMRGSPVYCKVVPLVSSKCQHCDQADIASADQPSQLVIALEPEAASVYCRKLKMTQLVGDRTGRQEELEDSVLVMEEDGLGEHDLHVSCVVLSLTVLYRVQHVPSRQ